MLAFGAALVLALGLVLVLAGGDEDVVVVDEPAETATSTSRRSTRRATLAHDERRSTRG